MVVLATAILGAAVAWLAGSRIESPADAAARTAPPQPSPILVPIEKRVLGSRIVTRGTARFGLPIAVSLAPSTLKAAPGLITSLPARNTQIAEGSVLLSASGRPVLVLQGEVPAYRDLAPSMRGEDVRQLEQALARLGFKPGPQDGLYDQQTAAAVARWYQARGWEPFAPSAEQGLALRALEREEGEARKAALSTAAAAAAAQPAVDSARTAAEHALRLASAELDARRSELAELQASLQANPKLALQSERARVELANLAAETELAAQIADEALVALDPRQPETARRAAKAKLDMARATLRKTQLEGIAALQAAEREGAQSEAKLSAAESRLQAARLAQQSARQEGDKAIQAALAAQKLAALDQRLAQARATQLAAELAAARQRQGIQLPVDEVVFIRALPVRVEELKASIGAAASGVVLTVTDNQLAVDSALPLEAAPLVKPGMHVAIDEPALAVSAKGVVHRVASTPGTQGVDGFHIYFEVRVEPSPVRLEGYSVRLTIPVNATQGAVTAVPLSALSLAADGSSRIQVQDKGALKYVVVKAGLSADGFVEIKPLAGTLSAGQLVVVGYNNAKAPEAP